MSIHFQKMHCSWRESRIFFTAGHDQSKIPNINKNYGVSFKCYNSIIGKVGFIFGFAAKFQFEEQTHYVKKSSLVEFIARFVSLAKYLPDDKQHLYDTLQSAYFPKNKNTTIEVIESLDQVSSITKDDISAINQAFQDSYINFKKTGYDKDQIQRISNAFKNVFHYEVSVFGFSKLLEVANNTCFCVRNFFLEKRIFFFSSYSQRDLQNMRAQGTDPIKEITAYKGMGIRCYSNFFGIFPLFFGLASQRDFNGTSLPINNTSFGKWQFRQEKFNNQEFTPKQMHQSYLDHKTKGYHKERLTEIKEEVRAYEAEIKYGESAYDTNILYTVKL